ncbi:unnamed protein product [Moneuplotes crassus]|uniref:Uncharacterized protein n=1 Tax=Euplotes crassus TaxID=5936 RepID=A0AAD2D5A2_EUPCR|nr:unnamed protein product [Moneuplotes crassus]
MLLAACALCQGGNSRFYSEEELVEKKGFIACHNLGRVKAMENYMEISQTETNLAAGSNTVAWRYMIDVIHTCLNKVSEADKDTIFQYYQDGEELPDISFLSNDLFIKISEAFKSAEDLQIPEDQMETKDKVSENADKFRATFEKNKKKANKAQQGLHILGFNVDNLSTGTKAIYALIIIGTIGFFLLKATSVLFREDNANPKHQRPKKKGSKGRKKAKTT